MAHLKWIPSIGSAVASFVESDDNDLAQSSNILICNGSERMHWYERRHVSCRPLGGNRG